MLPTPTKLDPELVKHVEPTILQLQEGDILVLKFDPGKVNKKEQEVMAMGLRQLINDTGKPNVTGCLLPRDFDLELVKGVREYGQLQEAVIALQKQVAELQKR